MIKKKMNWQRACVLLEKAGYKSSNSQPDFLDSSVTTTKKEIEIIDFNLD
ncbi:MAG: hypothetical protein HC917_15945, partial [Richelia sp. SM2_1_7]|nr:hypothetical protein [Richelia sp. SM2_1_7]